MSSSDTLPPLPSAVRGARLRGAEAAQRASQVSGPFQATPRAFLSPADAESVQALVQWAHENGVALIPRGAGTGMPGGNLGSSVVVSLAEGLDWIEANPDTGTVRAGAGAVAAHIDQEARRHMGRHLPFLPASARWCTIGGMAANNAAGAGSFGHGTTANWVVGLRGLDARGRPFHLSSPGLGPSSEPDPDSPSQAATASHDGASPEPFSHVPTQIPLEADGSPAGWPDVRKNSSGYALDRFLPHRDALQLLVGSEGTLAVITEVELRTAPVPRARGVALLPARSPEDVVELALGAQPAGADACELLGRRFMEIAGLDTDPLTASLADGAFALLLLEVSGTPDEVQEGLERCRELGRQVAGEGIRAASPDDAQRLWALRKAASPVIAQQAGHGLVSTQFIEDSVVPVRHLGRYMEELDRILKASGFDAVVFGHAGDGNLHVNPLVDTGSSDWRPRVRQVLEQVVDLVAELGGTLAGEHGDGRLRAPFLERIWGSTLATAFADIKNELDPQGTLNPGVIVPLPGQDPLTDFVPRPRTHP